jgi:hypothetical protein
VHSSIVDAAWLVMLGGKVGIDRLSPHLRKTEGYGRAV